MPIRLLVAALIVTLTACTERDRLSYPCAFGDADACARMQEIEAVNPTFWSRNGMSVAQPGGLANTLGAGAMVGAAAYSAGVAAQPPQAQTLRCTTTRAGVFLNTTCN